jgi:Secretion system C-terminal sorting domain
MKHVLLLFILFTTSFALQAQKSSKIDLSVYPNPAVEYISVQDDNDVVGKIVVFNLVGKKMKSFEISKGDSYYVADLPKGMYLVQILDHNSKLLTTQRVNKR